MSHIKEPALPLGSTVLVTGANGYIASHICDQFVKAGYKVRATVRDAVQHAWLPKFFEEHHGPGKFELVEVKDFQDAEAVKKAVEGVHGVVHTTTSTSFCPDPNEVVTPSVNGALTIARAAADQGVKRFVYTSSQIAAFYPIMNKVFTVTHDTWYDEAVEAAWAPPPYEPERGMSVYGAAKVQSEKSLWEFVRSERPNAFVLNTVLPDLTVGEPLSVEDTGYLSSASCFPPIYLGNEKALQMVKALLTPQHHVAVDDIALLHVIALLRPDVQGERIFGFAEPMGWNDVLAIFRRKVPGWQALSDDPDEGKVEYTIEPAKRADQLLKEYKGGDRGFRPVEDAVMENVQKFVKDPKAELKGRLWT